VKSTSDTLAEVETTAAQSGPGIWFPYVSASTREDYEVGGSENGDLIRTTASSFGYDGYGNLLSSSQTVTDNDTGSPYSGFSWTTSVTNTPDADTSTWCLSLLTQTQVTYSDTYDNTSIARTRQFTPDLTNCRYTQIVTAPGGSYQVTEALGYDSFGNIDSDTVTGQGMAARVTTANWGATGQFPMSVTDPTGATTSFNYNLGLGLVTSTTDPNGLMTSWQYSPLGRLSQETRPDGTYTTWSRSAYSGSDPVPRMVVTEQAHDTAGNVIRTTTEELDMLDRPYLEQTNLLDGSTATVMQESYDSLGRVASEQEPYEGGTVGAVQYSYDALNRVTASQRPTSASDSTPATTTYQYQGDTTTVTDANGHTRTLVHDVNGWLRRSEDDLGYQVIFGYDAAGSRTTVTDNQGNTLWTGTWAYGVAPFLTGETEMDSGAWGFSVDALGDRTAWTDPKNQHFSEQYDLLSRPETRSEPDLFTQWTWGTSAAAHNLGKLASICTGTGQNPTACSGSGESESWSYDGDGRLYQRAISLPSMGTYTYTWQYNSTTGMPQSLTYPTGSSGQALTLQYGYAYGYLQSITDTLDSPNVVVWKADAMDPAGQVTQDTLGNGIITTRAFDAVTHFLTSAQSGDGGGTAVQNMSFLYDPVGNVLQRQDNNLGLTENFYYDGDDRLQYSTLNGTQNLSISYDAMGNITNRSDVANDATWTYDPNHKHQVKEAGSIAYEYVYDANGNMTSRAGSSITWTTYNYPSAIDDSATGESISFDYGPNRNPWLETTQEPSGTTETYRLGSLMDIIVGGSGNTDRDYIYAGNDPVAVDERTSSSNNLYYFQTDQQGSISSITNASGQVAVNESFTAYGARRNPSTWSGAPPSSDLTAIAGITQHGYTFQRALGEQMELNDMVGRIQDATVGRFVSADPAVPRSGDPQSWNIYSYTENNPLTYVDPSGFQQCQDFSVGNYVFSRSGNGDWTYDGFQATGGITQQCWGSNPAPLDSGRGDGGQGNGSGKSASKKAQYYNQQQSNPKRPTKTPGACSDLSSFECQACVTTYLNNTYGNFGGFIASTFNAQQSIPGLSGQSLFNTLAPTAEIGLAKFGAGQGLQFGGDFIAMNTSGAGGFWLGTSLEYAGAMVAPVLGVIGAATTPFATVATSIARSACGG
jgi:RHS repeat-associated protein